MKHQPYRNVTAQSINVQTLLYMIDQLKEGNDSAMRVVPVVVFMAFSIEAYLNSLGSRRISYWDELERLPWRSKVSILHESAGNKPRWGESHLQFATSIFSLRDKLAHGKPERIEGPIFDDYDTAFKFSVDNRLRPAWFTNLNRSWAIASMEKFTALMSYLAEMQGFDKSDHLLLATGGMIKHEE